MQSDIDDLDEALGHPRTDNGESTPVLTFPPRPIVPKAIAEFIDEIIEDGIPQLVTIDDIKISTALESILQSLLGSIIVCCKIGKKDVCKQCQSRYNLVEAVRIQIRAEMVSLYDVRKELAKWQHDNIILRSYIDINEGTGTVDRLVRQSNMKVEK